MADTSSVAGVYTGVDYAHQFASSQYPAGQFQDAVATLTLSSTGTYTNLLTVNMDGVIAKVSTNGTFTITTDGTFTSTSQQSGDTMTGHISSSGTLVMGQTTVRGSSVGYPANNNAPEVVVAVKNGGTFSNASIAGSYTLIDYSHQYSGEYQCGVGTLTLSSNGTYTTAFTGNTDGVIAKASISGTYTVTADGAFTTTSTQWGDTFTGRISSSGVIVEAQTTVKGSVPAHPDNNCPEITVAVKNGGATFSNASVAGTYTLIDYAHQFPTTQNPAGQYQDAVGTMTLNSNGTYTAAFTANMDGVIGQASTSGTYTIAADGTYTSTSKDSGDTMTGRISSSGVMVAAQTTVRGSTPGFPSDNNAPEFIVGLRNEGTLTPASKNLVGGVGNDIMSGAAGNDTIDGGGGVNTAVYFGNLANYTITKSSTGYIVKDNTGADGTDTLTNIQTLQFANQSVTLDGKAVPITSATPQTTLAAPAANANVLGSGLDVINLNTQPSSAYTLTANSDGSFNLARSGSTNYVTGVMQVQFSDKIMNVAPANSLNAGVALLYQAALNRAPEADGLAYWDKTVTTQPNATTLNPASGAANGIISIASGFTGSAEFISKYGPSLSASQFVTQLYSNVLDRQADSGGLNYWVSQINAGVSREQILAGFAESAEGIHNATVGYVGQSGAHAAWLFLT